jgi:hypothetical protein
LDPKLCIADIIAHILLSARTLALSRDAVHELAQLLPQILSDVSAEVKIQVATSDSNTVSASIAPSLQRFLVKHCDAGQSLRLAQVFCTTILQHSRLISWILSNPRKEVAVATSLTITTPSLVHALHMGKTDDQLRLDSIRQAEEQAAASRRAERERKRTASAKQITDVLETQFACVPDGEVAVNEDSFPVIVNSVLDVKVAALSLTLVSAFMTKCHFVPGCCISR